MSEVVLPLLVITLLILLNGLFVAAEFAIVAARRVRLEARARRGGWALGFVRRILGSAPLQDRYIAVAQLGITLATIGLGMYGEPSIAGWIHRPLARLGGIGEAAAHSIGSVVAVLLMTYFHVVVGEMIPKALALRAPERVALGVSRSMHVSGMLFLPLVALLTAVGNGLLRLFRIPLTGEARLYSPAELSRLVRESHEEGAVSEEEERLINNILEFGEREVRHVMLPRLRVEALPLDASWEDVRRTVARKRYSRYPVYRNDLDDVVGVLHAKDFIEHDLLVQDGSADPADLRSLARRVPRVPEAMPVERLLAAFKRLHVHMALVVEEHGGTAGIVTLDDLLEEVVGEVAGEPEREEAPEVESLGDQAYLVDGAMQLHRFNERFETSLVAEESTTIAGFVLERLRRVPEQGEEVLTDGLALRVHELKGLAIARLRVELRRRRDQSKPSEQ
jgi:CBS domain containing-hemolysin-like protein